MTDNTANTAAETERTIEYAKVPAGYELKWPHGQHSLLKVTDTAPEGSSPWLVLCNSHGTTTKAASAKDAETLGAKGRRPGWCRKCKADAAKAAEAGK